MDRDGIGRAGRRGGPGPRKGVTGRVERRSGPAAAALPLTPRQHEVLAHLHLYVAEHGYPPTARELSAACALGGSHGAHRMLETLERKGYLTRERGKRRSLTLVERRFNLEISRDGIRKLELFRKVAVFHRDCGLQVALRLPDGDDKDAVLASAIGQHALVRSISRALPPSPAIDPERGIDARTVEQLSASDFWPAFVVHSIVWSGLVARLAARENGSRELAVRLAAVHLGRLAERDDVVASRWVAELERRGNAPELSRLAAELRDAYTIVLPELADAGAVHPVQRHPRTLDRPRI